MLLPLPETVRGKLTVVRQVKRTEMGPLVHTDDLSVVSFVFKVVPFVVEVSVVVGIVDDCRVVTSISTTPRDGHRDVILRKNVVLFCLFGDQLRSHVLLLKYHWIWSLVF